MQLGDEHFGHSVLPPVRQNDRPGNEPFELVVEFHLIHILHLLELPIHDVLFGYVLHYPFLGIAEVR